MKKWMCAALALVLLLTSGCSFKVKKDTFTVPLDKITEIEIQRGIENEEGKTVFYGKVITEEADREKVCEMIRTLPVKRANRDEPHPITNFTMIIVLRGEKTHRLILSEEMAYYDQLAYEYGNDKIYSSFLELYDIMDYSAKETEPDRF